MKDNRPINLNITTIKFPLPAITSILHRISGGFLFIALAAILYLLDLSLASEAGFAQVTDLLSGNLVKFTVWVFLAALTYHFVAGCKHLLMDLGIGETLAGAAIGARLTLLLSIIIAAGLGVWLW